MHKPNWTPGPWKAVDPLAECSLGYGEGPPLDIVTQEGKLIASISESEMPIGEDIPNAHLIAAAPDLYEALDMAIGLLREVFHDNPNHPLWKAGPAAIAKARGESHLYEAIQEMLERNKARAEAKARGESPDGK